MNLYASLDAVKRALRISSTAHDAYLLEVLEGASRAVDNYCRRHFYTLQETRYFGVTHPCQVLIDDVLSVSAVGADSECDGTFDGEAWVEGTDYVLQPRHKWPKYELRPHKNSDKGLWIDREYLKITGTWGYGDGVSANPWRAAGVTLTVADGTSTTGTLSASGAVSAGETLQVGSEQVYVESVSGTTATIRRAMNGTTAAAHSATAVYRAIYPAGVTRFTVALASEEYQLRTARGVRQEMLGTHQVMYAAQDDRIFQRALGAYRRATTN